MKIYSLEIDLVQPSPGYSMQLVEDDFNSATLKITVKNNGEPYDLTDITGIEIPFSKLDGTFYMHDLENGIEVVDAKNGVITCLIDSRAISDPGSIFFELRLLKDNALATANSRLRLVIRRPIVHDGSVKETNEYPLLQRMIIQCQAITDEEAVRVANENARLVFEAYNNSTQYVIGNKVTYYGSSYRCIKNSLGNTPIDAEYWLLIAQKGGISYPTFSVDDNMYLFMHDDFNYEGHVSFRLEDGELIQEVV